ncbi:hypothetical protein MMC14_010386, partial [Varicellaria rhodocarpa]|nr:hypothetical protein [Varicellaria rhodocarpa]
MLKAATAFTAISKTVSDDAVQPSETVLANGNTVYGNAQTVQEIKTVTEEFPSIWIDQGSVVNVPEQEWMDIPLLPDWRDNYKPGQAR